MATLRQMIDGSREVFDATLAAHNPHSSKRGKKTEVEIRGTAQYDGRWQVESVERRNAQSVTQYVYSVSASGEQLQAEYQRGYYDGYRDGVQVNATKTVERRPTPSIPVLQSNREVSLEE